MMPRPPLPAGIVTASLVLIAIVAVGCTASPGQASSGPSASAGGATPSASASGASTAPSASTAPASPSSVPAISPSAMPAVSPGACAIPGPGRLASDTLIDATLEATTGGARLTFVFGTRPPEAVAEPTIALGFVEPPFSMAGSGQSVTVAGERFLKVRMAGMVVDRPNGEPVYTGQRDLRLAGEAISQATMVDEFEGVVTWIVGLAGTGCPVITAPTVGGTKVVIELAG